MGFLRRRLSVQMMSPANMLSIVVETQLGNAALRTSLVELAAAGAVMSGDLVGRMRESS